MKRWFGWVCPHQKLLAGQRAPAVGKVKTVLCRVHTSSPWESSLITIKTDAPVGQAWRWTTHAPFFPLPTHRLKNPSSHKPKSLLFFNHTLHGPILKLLGTVISICPSVLNYQCSSWCLAGLIVRLSYNCLVLTSRLFISEGHSLHFMSVWLLASCRTLPSSSINIKGKWSFLDFTWQVSKELFYVQSSKIRSQTPAKNFLLHSSFWWCL